MAKKIVFEPFVYPIDPVTFKVCGADEAGRGPLMGNVVAACVILDPNNPIAGLNDSKKLTEKKRNELRSVIEKNALAWSVAFVGVNEIDEINILNASILAMHRALDELTIDFEHIAVDGNRFKDYKNIESTCIIKGDSKFQNIAAASILAKTYRDDYMKKIHEEFPAYNWSKNKGYPTKEHRNAIEKLGPCKYHRLSFSLLPKQVKLDL